MFTYFVYPNLSRIQSRGFQCVNVFYYGQVMKYDTSVACDFTDQGFRRYFFTNVILCALVQGIPIFYFMVLYNRRHLLNPSGPKPARSCCTPLLSPSETVTATSMTESEKLRIRRPLETESRLAPYRFLFTHYRCECWWFEVVESFRRQIFVSLLPLCFQGHVGLGRALRTVNSLR